MTKNQIEEKLCKIFGDGVKGVVTDNRNKEAVFSVQGEDLSFENLLQVSNLLQTSKISSTYFRPHGGCSTCGYGEQGNYHEVVCREVGVPL